MTLGPFFHISVDLFVSAAAICLGDNKLSMIERADTPQLPFTVFVNDQTARLDGFSARIPMRDANVKQATITIELKQSVTQSRFKSISLMQSGVEDITIVLLDENGNRVPGFVHTNTVNILTASSN